MPKLRVLIALSLEKAEIAKIAAISPEIEVIPAVDELRAELGTYSPTFGADKKHELTAQEASRRLDQLLAQTEVICGWRYPHNLLSRAPKLKWIHNYGVGIDLVPGEIVQSDVIITNASGIHSHVLAEYTFCLILMLEKHMPRIVINQTRKVWQPVEMGSLRGKTLGIVGVGKIGRDLVPLARAFGMKILGVTRSAAARQNDVGGVDILFPAGELREMLPKCDYVVLAVPLTAETRGLIGGAELRAMKPSAYLINIARGAVVKQDELIEALKQGWIAGAALDVFEEEPLPPGNELWGLPNVIVSPHSAGYWDEYNQRITDLFCENLRRYLAGQKLLNVVDKKRGY